MATEIKSESDLARWLKGRPVADARVIASRAALRVLPLLSRAASRISPMGPNFAELTSAIFRLNALAWGAAKYPPHANKLSRAAYAAYAAAAHAAAYAADAAAAATAAYAAAVADADATANAAHAAAYAADAAAAADAKEQLWQSVSADAQALTDELAPEILANRPLWPGGIPNSIAEHWRKLIQSLPPNEDWELWTAWYDRRLTGRVDREVYELVFPRLPDEEWKKGPKAANAWIKAELAKLEPPPIPEQGAGPHVEIEIETGLVIPAKPASLDEAGNHIGRLKSQLPLVQQCSQDLRDSLGRSDEHRELFEAVSRYDNLVNLPLDDIDFDRLWGEGVFLEEAAAAVERRVDDVLSEPLSDEREAKLKALLRVHGPFILASKAGQENLAAANAYELRPDEIREQQAAAQELAIAFKAHPEVIALKTALLFADAVAQPESSAHPERSAAFKAGFGLNIVVVIGGGAAIAGLCYIAGAAIGTTGAVVAGLVFSEALKKSDPFLAVTGLLTSVINEVANKDYEALAKKLRKVRFDDYRKFMIEHEDLLRRYAGTRKQNRWLHEHLDWLKNVGPEK